MVISGASLIKISDTLDPLATINMHAVANLTNKSSTPANKFESNHLRLPSQFNDVLEAFKIMSEPRQAAGGMWKHKEAKYTELLKSGQTTDLAEILACIYAPHRGKEFDDIHNELSYSEKIIAETAMDMLAEDVTFGANFIKHGPKRAIRKILTCQRKDVEPFLNDLKKHEKPFDPYMNGKEFKSIFGMSRREAKTANGQDMKVDIPEPTKPHAAITVIKPGQNDARVGVSTASGHSGVASRQSKPATARKRVVLGETSNFRPQSKSDNLPDDIKLDNIPYYKQIQNRMAMKGMMRGAVMKASAFLDPIAFQLHVRVALLKTKEDLDKVAEDLGLSKDKAVEMYNQSAEILRPHFGQNGQLIRVPSFLKAWDEKPVRQSRGSARPQLVIKGGSQDLYDRYVTDVPSKGLVKGAFNKAAAYLDAQAFELHTKMYFVGKDQRVSLESAASSLGMDVETAKRVHDESVGILTPYFGDNGEFQRKPTFLKTLAEQAEKAKPRSTRPRTSFECVVEHHDGDEFELRIGMNHPLTLGAEDLSVKVGYDEQGHPVICVSGKNNPDFIGPRQPKNL